MSEEPAYYYQIDLGFDPREVSQKDLVDISINLHECLTTIPAFIRTRTIYEKLSEVTQKLSESGSHE